MLISTQTSHLNSSPSGSTDVALEEAAEGLLAPKPGLPLGSSPAVLEAELEVVPKSSGHLGTDRSADFRGARGASEAAGPR